MNKQIPSVLFVLIALLFACTDPNQIQIIIADNASVTEQLTAADLKEDIEKTTGLKAVILSGSEESRGKKIRIGTSTSNQKMIDELRSVNVALTKENPGPRGGIWHKANDQTLILAGSDIQGMQYAVYDFSKEILGLDPLIDWTGHSITPISNKQIFEIENRRIDPPVVPLLVYFENDVDELANLKEPLLQYVWTSYTEMIDALVRLRYNGIQLFDMLGRPEFFLRESYKQIVPDYQLDIDYVEKMIDYAHDKGMQVQIDMALGYQIKPMESKYADCWKTNKTKWINTWEHYLTETPLMKADIFQLRPRNQVWDWEYESTCGEDKVTVFNEVYASLDSVLAVHKPEATKVVICYDDGMEMFNQGFTPPRDWIIAWSDDGYAGFEYWPESTKGYDFGTYMHAGFWKNHTVSDPYPERIDTIMHHMFSEYNAISYCEVNGQQFRPFILNIEAFSEVCRDPDSYSGEGFYDTWASRYFPDSVKKEAIQIMKLWHEASFGKGGYVENLWEIREAIAYLSMQPIVRPGKSPIAYDAERVADDVADNKDRLVGLKNAIRISDQLLPKTDPESYFFHDQIYLPLRIYGDLLEFEWLLHQMFRVKRSYEQTANEDFKQQARALLVDCRDQLDKLYDRRLTGDKNPKWDSWYDPAKRRPNNGFPTSEMLDEIEKTINEKW